MWLALTSGWVLLCRYALLPTLLFWETLRLNWLRGERDLIIDVMTIRMIKMLMMIMKVMIMMMTVIMIIMMLIAMMA